MLISGVLLPMCCLTGVTVVAIGVGVDGVGVGGVVVCVDGCGWFGVEVTCPFVCE